jgi:hypothetical protein
VLSFPSDYVIGMKTLSEGERERELEGKGKGKGKGREGEGKVSSLSV